MESSDFMRIQKEDENRRSPLLRMRSGENQQWEKLPESDVYNEPWRALGSWFLGPRAENRDEFRRLVTKCLDWYSDCREDFFPTDPCYITDEVKSSTAYKGEMKDTEEQLEQMHDELSHSIPFFSPRYQGHMIWETTIPSTLGYIAGMLWNPNNVDSSCSPVTTVYELTVGNHLCELMGFDNNEHIKPWAHLTGCGSVSNVESLWAARNLKFHPLALKSVLMDESAPELRVGLDFKVYIPKRGAVALRHCSTWELLNLGIDDVCGLSKNLSKFIGPDEQAISQKIEDTLKKHALPHIGLLNFLRKHDIETPVLCCSGTGHYSWAKSATLLGIGDQQIRNIQVDLNARLSIKMLRIELDQCVAARVPVMMVVAVIGSTEESAVDPIEEIVAIREEYWKEKGLNFVIHADAAWGGYMLTMLKEPSQTKKQKRRIQGEDYVPFIPLSTYTEKQYRSVKLADTVTIDPHKTGLCHYPAGALAYRNGTMKNFISMLAAAVFHGDEDLAVGVFGLEGSKPGAAAAGVLLSHRVIGLDQMGYGRILGQCQFTTKLFYCLWMTVAEDYDDFRCVNLIDLPPKSEEFPYNESEAKTYIRQNILGKNNNELMNYKTKEFLRNIGPDALINTFVVNLKNERSTAKCNQLNDIIHQETSIRVGESPKRTPLFLTTSTFVHERYGLTLTNLKRRLGLATDDEETLVFLRNTNMNPFQASERFVAATGGLFRNIVLNSIGAVTDPDDYFTFIAPNTIEESNGKLFLELLPCFSKRQFQYQVIVTMIVREKDEIRRIKNLQESSLEEPVYFQTKKKIKIMQLLHEYNNHQFLVYKEDGDCKSSFSVALELDEVFRYTHLENLHASAHIQYPKHQTYFLYGDDKHAFISHVITKYPNFHQVVQLDSIPHSMPHNLLDYGLTITIPDINGTPLHINDEIVDPLQTSSYTVEYAGKQSSHCKTTIRFKKVWAKKWFDGYKINM